MTKLYQHLTYAGLLPFIGGALCFIANVEVIPLLGDTVQVFGVYGLVIASFMAGSHWGIHLSLKDKWSKYLPVLSNVNAILLWVSFLVFSFKVLLVALSVSFFASLFIDKKLLQNNVINIDYFRTRCWVTLIVVSTLIISGVFA